LPEGDDEELSPKGEGLQEIADHYWGTTGFIIISLLLTMLAFCAVASYEMVLTAKVGDWLSLASVETKSGWSRLFVCLLACGAGIAMTFLPRRWREAGGMQVKIWLTIFSLGGFLVGLTLKSLSAIATEGMSPTAKFADFGISHLALAFATHITTIALSPAQTGTLAKHSTHAKRQQKALLIEFLAVFGLIALPSSLVYLSLGDSVQSDALSSYRKDDPVVILIQIAIYAKVTCSLFTIFPDVLLNYVRGVVTELYDEDKWKQVRLWVMIGLHVALIAIATFCEDLISVLSIGGGLGGCLGMFCLPSLCMLKRNWKKPEEFWWMKRLGHVLFVGFGLFAAAISVFYGVKAFITSATGA
jgi:hypothetical protein